MKRLFLYAMFMTVTLSSMAQLKLTSNENKELLTTILRDEWGFKVMVMTDWTGTRNTKLQVAAGNDLLTPGNEEQYKQIVEFAKNGSISMSDIW